MADPFVAEIRIFPFNFAPRGWAWCDGQLLPLSQNTALFSLLGTTYGGNGKSNFATCGWAWCDGQLLPLSQNTALFSLLGTTYGGNGKSNFALPNLQGSAPMHPGQGPGLSLHDLGETGGSETVTLLESEIPSHSHALQGQAGIANSNDPAGTVWSRPFGGNDIYGPPANLVSAAPEALAPAGGDQPHNNLQPYLTFYFAIALQGVFPPRG